MLLREVVEAALQTSELSARYAHIDAMRAIAALLVVLIHVAESFAQWAGNGQFIHLLAKELRVGVIGVVLFFIVSGFVIPSSLRNAGDRRVELAKFGIRRFFRLYPIYWLSILLALITTYWIWGRQPGIWQILANVSMLQRFLGYEDIQGLYWTLATELVFYTLCAALFAIGLLHKTGAILILAYVLSGIYFADVWLGVPLRHGFLSFLFVTDLCAHLALMLAGALLRQWHDQAPVPNWVKSGLVILLIAFLLPLAGSASIVDSQIVWDFPRDGGKSIAVLIFINVALGLKLNHPILSWVGERSYSVYLMHPVLFYFLLWIISQPHMEWARGHHLSVYIVTTLLTVLLLSAATYRWVELPLMRLGRRLSRFSAEGGKMGDGLLSAAG